MSDFIASQDLGQQPCGSRDAQAAPATAALAGVWRDPGETPQVPVGGEAYFIVAVRRGWTGKVYTYPAVYLNQMVLRFEDEEDRAVTGWQEAEANDDGDGHRYLPLGLGPDDALMGWCELPKFERPGATASTTPASGNEEVAATRRQEPREAQKPASPQDRIDVEGLKTERRAVARIIDAYGAETLTVANLMIREAVTRDARDLMAERALATAADGIMAIFAELIAQRAALVEKLERLSRDHYDDDGVIDLRSAYLIVGRDSTGSLQLKGSFIARLEEARTLLTSIQAGGAK